MFARIPLTVVGLPPKSLLRGNGRISIEYSSWFECRAGLERTVEASVSLGTPADQPRISTSSGSIDSVPWGLSPTTQTVMLDFSKEEVTEVTVTPRRKLTEFRRVMDAPSVRLSEYIPPGHAQGDRPR
jgi:hypothetical protein